MKDIITHFIERQFPDLQKADGSINHNALARLSGVPQPTITRLLNNQIKEPSRQIIQQLAAALQIEPAVLHGYSPITHKKSSGMAAKEAPAPYFTKNPALHFVFKVTDTDNSPEIMPGDELTINPQTKPRQNHFVLVNLDNDLKLRRFLKKSARTYELKAVNPKAKRYKISDDPKQQKILGTATRLTRALE